MDSFEKLKNFLDWYDTRIALWQQDIIDQPQHAASFRQLIKADLAAKQRMMDKHNVLKHQASVNA